MLTMLEGNVYLTFINVVSLSKKMIEFARINKENMLFLVYLTPCLPGTANIRIHYYFDECVAYEA